MSHQKKSVKLGAKVLGEFRKLYFRTIIAFHKRFATSLDCTEIAVSPTTELTQQCFRKRNNAFVRHIARANSRAVVAATCEQPCRAGGRK